MKFRKFNVVFLSFMLFACFVSRVVGDTTSDQCGIYDCCSPSQCCDEDICDVRSGSWENDASSNSCFYKCNSLKLAETCADISPEDTHCLEWGFREAFPQGSVIKRRWCQKAPAHNGRNCGAPYVFGDNVLIPTCLNGKCVTEDDPNHGEINPIVDSCNGLSVCSCVAENGIGRCTYDFDPCSDGQYRNNDGICEDFSTKYCETVNDCKHIRCYVESCDQSVCNYEPLECEHDNFCDIFGEGDPECVHDALLPELYMAAKDFTVCRVESEDDFTKYEDHIYFKNPRNHLIKFIQYFEVEAGKSTHDQGNWTRIAPEVPYDNSVDHLYNETYDPVKEGSLFHPDVYRIRFMNSTEQYSPWEESGVVQKKEACKKYLED